MKSTAIPSSRRHSPSSDRFLGAFSFSPPSASSTAGYELNEDEMFWTGDFTHSAAEISSVYHNRDRRSAFQQPQKSGILAALTETEFRSQTLTDRPVLCRKPSFSSSSSKMIPSIPRSPQICQERELPQSVSSRKFHQHQSAPMNVPILSTAMAKQRHGGFPDVDDDIEDDEMLPPHEIVARGSGMLPNTTFSVLEGVGRTLKGRDLRQVRNAIWRKTGFLD